MISIKYSIIEYHLWVADQRSLVSKAVQWQHVRDRYNCGPFQRHIHSRPIKKASLPNIKQMQRIGKLYIFEL